MKKNVLNALVYAFVIVLTIFGLSCLIVNFTVCDHAWIVSAITLPAALAISIGMAIKKLKFKPQIA